MMVGRVQIEPLHFREQQYVQMHQSLCLWEGRVRKFHRIQKTIYFRKPIQRTNGEKHFMLHQHMEWSMIMCSLLHVKTIPKYAEMVM